MELTLANRQRRVRVDIAWLRRFAEKALASCTEHSGNGHFALKEHPVIEVSIVSDRTIARVHVDFMAIEGATDVITFEHGELVISADTAARCAEEHGHSVEAELGLYIVHGLLHLNGYDDLTPPERKTMHAVQNRIWKRLREA